MTSASPSRALLAALAAAAAAAMWATRVPVERAVLPAVEADAFAALTGRAPASTPEMWERLKAMGVAAVVLREETAAELADRGEVLHFSRAEVEKWRALGLVAPGGGPTPDSLWARDPKILERLTGALAARGIDASTVTANGGGRSISLPSGVDLARVPAGFDPETVTIVSAAGLIPVAASTGPWASVAGRRLWIRTLPVTARPPEVLRGVHGRAMRLLVLRPSPGAGPDETLESLRGALRTVKAADLPGVLPGGGQGSAPSRPEDAARVLLFYAIGLLGPLLAARAGLSTERAVRGWVSARAPIASPVPETLAGLAVAWAAASVAGLLASAALAPERREEIARAWTVWTLAAPMITGAAALFAAEGPSVRARWRAPLRLSDLAAALALASALLLLLAPRAALGAAGVWESVDRLSAAADRLWWWPWRWREILIGAPSLTVALILVGRREAGSGEAKFLGDPRGWLALGLLAPSGAVAAIGSGGMSPELAVSHGAAACAIGGAIGFALAGLRARIEAWVLRPTDAGLLT